MVWRDVSAQKLNLVVNFGPVILGFLEAWKWLSKMEFQANVRK